MIRHVEHRELDRGKWDRCIENSSFETIYPYSWYLDLVSPGWEGLIAGDYEKVMPLTPARKYGLHLLLQPVLAQQLGVFSARSPQREDILEFIGAIPSRFRYVDICLNRDNLPHMEGIRHSERINYELDPGKPDPYNTNTRRNLQKGREYPFELREIDTAGYLDLKYSSEKNVQVPRTYLERLFGGLTERKRAKAFGLFLGQDLQAAAVLGYSKTRVIYMNGCGTRASKENRAMFVLMDRLIGMSRGGFPVFDFEGSNLPGVARFFEGFGGTKTLYPGIKRIHLPFFRIRPIIVI